MPLDVAVDEGAERNHPLSRGTHGVERRTGQGATHPFALVSVRHLGVVEDQPVSSALVVGASGILAVDGHREAAFAGPVLDLDGHVVAHAGSSVRLSFGSYPEVRDFAVG